MPVLERISFVLGVGITPFILLTASICMLRTLPCRDIFRPALFWRTLREQSGHPFRALSLALAGTLGVGNITGVASALILGGPGVVFWMWVGTLLVLPVKYAEVYLAVQYREKDMHGWHGGAMYYIRNGLTLHTYSPRKASLFATGFAILCFLNAYITGNFIQANAAAALFPKIPSFFCGIFLAVLLMTAMVYGVHRLERITGLLIPVLSVLYIGVCIIYIFQNRAGVPYVFKQILKAAFAPVFRGRAAVGGCAGFTLWQGIRFGIMRGIFSNEAGCGTSPTAHAAADTKSPHHQAVLGVMEVLFDTIVLCSLTAFTLLLAAENGFPLPWQDRNADTVGIVLDAFRDQCSSLTSHIIQISIFLFAFSTMLAQLYYGTAALRFMTKNKKLQSATFFLAPAAALFGSVLSAPSLWLTADLLIGSMTTVNCIFLIFLRKDCRDGSLRYLRKS